VRTQPANAVVGSLTATANQRRKSASAEGTPDDGRWVSQFRRLWGGGNTKGGKGPRGGHHRREETLGVIAGGREPSAPGGRGKKLKVNSSEERVGANLRIGGGGGLGGPPFQRGLDL